ncbi:MAG TPA: hypothetical protein VFS39_18355 [Nitrospira sp.]|nr:hypothetical protein [Nitrospira sp.]
MTEASVTSARWRIRRTFGEQGQQSRRLVFAASLLLAAAAPALAWAAEPRSAEQPATDPLHLPFGVDPATRSLESEQRMREELRDQDLRIDTDSNRRMFRPKQPEPGYSEVRPYSGAEVPMRVRPLKPIP